MTIEITEAYKTEDGKLYPSRKDAEKAGLQKKLRNLEYPPRDKDSMYIQIHPDSLEKICFKKTQALMDVCRDIKAWQNKYGEDGY